MVVVVVGFMGGFLVLQKVWRVLSGGRGFYNRIISGLMVLKWDIVAILIYVMMSVTMRRMSICSSLHLK